MKPLNIIVFITASTLFVQCQSSGLSSESLEKFELTGNVRTLEETSFYPQKAIEIMDSITFDIDEGFNKSYTKQVFFDQNGNMTESKGFQPSYLSSHTIYDQYGEIKHSTEYNFKNEITRLLYSIYNVDGKPKLQKWTDKDSTVKYTKTFVYNDLGQLKKESSTSGPKSTFIYTYDKLGREKERKTFFKDKYFTKRIQKYAKNGKVSTKTAYDSVDSKLWVETFKYNGNKLTHNVYTHFKKEQETRIWYNKHGLYERSEEWNMNETSTRPNRRQYIYYQYDDKGNWIRRNLFEDNEVKQVKLRKIEYY